MIGKLSAPGTYKHPHIGMPAACRQPISGRRQQGSGYDREIVPLNARLFAWGMPIAVPSVRQNVAEVAALRAGPRPLTSSQPVASTVTGVKRCGPAANVSW